MNDELERMLKEVVVVYMRYPGIYLERLTSFLARSVSVQGSRQFH
jgi:hypothetical protein